MPPDVPPVEPGSGRVAREWLELARGHLALGAQDAVPGVPPSLLCFHAQQAAEMALKAVLIAHGDRPPRTHDLALLLEVLEQRGLSDPSLAPVASLTVYAVITRYPGAYDTVTWDHHRRAMALALTAVTWGEQAVAAAAGGQG